MADPFIRLALVGALVPIALFAWSVCGCLRKHDVHPLRGVAKALPRSMVECLLLVSSVLGFLKVGGSKGTNGVRGVSAPVPAPLFSSASVSTNGTWDFSAPPGSTVHERWRLRGAADDWFPLFPTGWSFALGDTSVTNIRVFSRGKSRLPDGTEISPLPAALGVVPEMNWQLLCSNSPSLFWHSLSSDGSLLLTWQNVLLHRAATNPVSVQAELRPSGGVTFRYDLSRLASDDPLSDVAPAAGGVSPDVPLSRGVTSVSFKSRDEAICDEARAAFEESLGGLDPFSCPEGSTNTVLEHVFYSGTTNGAFFYPQTNDSTAVLRVAVTGSGSGGLLVGGSYMPLVAPPQMRGGTPQGNPLMFPVPKGETVPVYLRGDGTLSVSFDSGEFAFGELPSLSENRHVGWINFPNTRATEPCIHDLGVTTKTVSLPASAGADDLACTWQGGSGVTAVNHPPRSATLTASFDPKRSGGVTYELSHPKRLFGRTEHAQTVRYCPRPGDDDPPFLGYGEEEQYGDCSACSGTCAGDCGCPASCGCPCCDHGICPVHSVPYEECESLHPSDYEDAATNAVATLAGVLYIRDPPVVGSQIDLEVPSGHVACCPCPDHQVNRVSVAYKSHRLRVTDSQGLPFSYAAADCTVDVAGVAPSEAVGDAELAFERNGEVYGRRGYTALGVGIRRDGVPLSRYNALSPSLGFPMAVCTNQWDAPELRLVTNVGLPTGGVRLELEGATGQFAVWCRDGDGWRKLAETGAAGDFPMHAWRAVMRGAGCGGSPELPVRLTSASPGSVRLVFRYWNVVAGAFVDDSVSQRITSVKPPLLPDLNYDGNIDNADLALYLAGRWFRFWTNEDTAKGDYVGQSSNLSPNASDLVVNGRLDLVNLFPVKLDLKPLVDAWGGGVRFVLWSPQGSSLRFCGLDAQPSEAWAFQTNDVYTTAGDPVHSADLIPVGGEGVEIDPADYLGFGNSPGVLAFEAANEVVRPDALTLLVVDGEDDTLFSCSIPLSLRSVDHMYRWRGLRYACGGSSSIPDRTGEPWNMPDDGLEDVDVFFLHGFNVSEADARNWSRQVFKRLWLSGSRARFHGFSWYGDYNLAGSTFNGLHYHQDVYHALKTSAEFKGCVEATQTVPAKRVVMAHSLGNMVAAEALRQGLAVGKYFMFNAAVASEAVDGTLQAGSPNDDGYSKYVPSDWNGYTNACWAANWFRWFQDDPSDARGMMGWPDYFSSALGNAGTVYNYYSSGDLVFMEAGTPPGLTAGLFHWPTLSWTWPFVNLNITEEACSWQKQETRKGIDPIAGTLKGGWGFHCWYETVGGEPVQECYSAAQANAMAADCSITNSPVFSYGGTPLNSRNASQDEVWLSLAKYVPAVSSPVGGSAALNRNNVNLNDVSDVGRPNEWGRDHHVQEDAWLHSDMKDMAFFYVYKFYEQLVTRGDMQ